MRALPNLAKRSAAKVPQFVQGIVTQTAGQLQVTVAGASTAVNAVQPGYLSSSVNDVVQCIKLGSKLYIMHSSGASSGGGGGGGAVDSVNGQTGVVSLDASDVGAVPTAAVGANNGVAELDSSGNVPLSELGNVPASAVDSVNGATGVVVLDASDVGALPSSDSDALMPTGGSTDDVLTKNSGTDFDASWQPAGGGGSSPYKGVWSSGLTNIVTDLFNRSNSSSSLGNADTGQTWSQSGGPWGINGLAAYTSASTPLSFAWIDAGEGDVQLDVDVPHIGTTSGLGFVLRLTDANNLYIVDFNPAGAYLFKIVAGSVTNILSASGTTVSGDHLRVTAVGSVLTMYRTHAGVETMIGTVTDATWDNTHTKHGLYDYTDDTTSRWDNFKCGVLATVTYDEGDLVTGSDNQLYVSLAGGNSGNDPTTDNGVHWSTSCVVPDNQAGLLDTSTALGTSAPTTLATVALTPGTWWFDVGCQPEGNSTAGNVTVWLVLSDGTKASFEGGTWSTIGVMTNLDGTHYLVTLSLAAVIVVTADVNVEVVAKASVGGITMDNNIGDQPSNSASGWRAVRVSS